jgi:hypothetical protein
MKEKRQPNLELLLAILISDGANEIEVEYDDHEWCVCVIEGNTGVGVARYASEEEKHQVDRALDRLRKEKSINVNGKTHRLSFKFRENFGDPSWRIRVSEQTNHNRTSA